MQLSNSFFTCFLHENIQTIQQSKLAKNSKPQQERSCELICDANISLISFKDLLTSTATAI